MDLRLPEMMDEALQLMGWIANMLSSCTESLHWVSVLSLFPLSKLPRILKAAVSASVLIVTCEFLKNWEYYYLQPSLTPRFSASRLWELSVTFKIWLNLNIRRFLSTCSLLFWILLDEASTPTLDKLHKINCAFADTKEGLLLLLCLVKSNTSHSLNFLVSLGTHKPHYPLQLYRPYNQHIFHWNSTQ